MVRFMIDAKIEEMFIKQFVKKRFRQRLLFELHGKKRRDGMSRFCHNAVNLLLENTIVVDGRICKEDIKRHLPKKLTGKQCYIMAYNESLDGILCQFEAALDLVLGNGMAAIIIFDGFAVIETEQCSGCPDRFVLCTSNPYKTL